MGKRKHRDREEREAREHRRNARSAASRMRHQMLDAAAHPEDIVAFNAEGFVGKRVHVTGTPNPVTPLNENEKHDPTTTTG